MKRKYYRAGTALLTAAVLALTACQGTGGTGDGEDSREEEAAMAAQKLADSIRQKYDEKYEYTDPIRGIARDEKLTLQLGFDIYDTDFTEYTQIVNVYQDTELKHPAGSHFEWDAEAKELSITPPRWEAGGISAAGLDESDPGYDPAQDSLFEKGELEDWGNLPRYYMVRYVDTETGETLDKPVVTVFTVDHEVNRAPKVSMRINEEGLPVFHWNEVPGAEKYYVMTMNWSEENGYSGNGFVRGSTEETEWIPDSAARFVTDSVSGGERQEVYETYYCVIAASEEGTSAISNVFNLKDIRNNYKMDFVMGFWQQYKLRCAEQDALNKLFDNNKQILDLKWNTFPERMTSTIDINCCPLRFINEWKKALKDPAIVHFAAVPKAWDYPLVGFGNDWWITARKTIYYEEILLRMNRPKSKKRRFINELGDIFLPLGSQRREFIKKFIPKKQWGLSKK